MAPNTTVSGTRRLIRGMAAVTKSGPMAASMTATGSAIKLMVGVASFTLMATYTTAIGRMTKLTGLDSIPTQTEHSMKAIGSMINNMARVKSNGQMVLNTRDSTNTARRTDLVNSVGLTSQATVAIL